MLLLSGCGSQYGERGSLFIYVETGEGAAGRRREDDIEEIRRMMQLLLGEFESAEPYISVQVNYIQSDRIVNEVIYRNTLGLGPDLVISSMRNAIDLKTKKATRTLPFTEDDLVEIHPLFRPTVGKAHSLTAAAYPQVACFDRRRVERALRTRKELLQSAGSGLRVGLPFRLRMLIWLTRKDPGRELLRTLLEGSGSGAITKQAMAERSVLVDFLQQLRTLKLQRSISFYSSTREMDEDFVNGDLDWIPCQGASLRSHHKQLGENLGISTLPGPEPGVPSQTVTSQKVWTLGPHSNKRQRRLASKFALFSVSRVMQKELLIASPTWFPVNERVLIPADQESIQQTLNNSLKNSISLRSSIPGTPGEHSRRVNRTIQDVVLGFLTPEAGATMMLEGWTR